MTADRFERQLPEILSEIALPQVPDYVDDILGQTAGLHQRPGWTFPERWLPMELAARTPLPVRQLPWRTIAVLALIGALILALVVASGSRRPRLPAPFGPAVNGSLIYDRGGDIYITDPGATHERLLIGGDSNDFAATWAPDGSRFFFARTVPGGLAVMTADADGENVRRLSAATLTAPESFDLSPTAGQLAVIDNVAGRRSLSILTLGGGAVRTLDLRTIEPTAYVAWRPTSGAELIFTGHPGGVASDLGLYAIDTGGGGLRELGLQRGESDRSLPDPTQYSFQDVSLSDDGSSAAYWNWETTVQSGRTCFIHVIDLATGRDRRMSFDPTASCEVAPIFSPDGLTIVAERQANDGVAQLFVAPVDGSAPARLIGPTYRYDERAGFVLSPDGTQVVLVAVAGKPRLVNVATGATEDTKVVPLNIPSWQRLAP